MMTTNTATHTPEPWEARWSAIRYAGQRESINRCVIGAPKSDTGGSFVTARIEGPFPLGEEVAHANARRIVDCVNGCAGKDPGAYDDLLASCKVLLALTDPEFVEPSRGLGLRNARTIAAAAIAKAAGKEPENEHEA